MFKVYRRQTKRFCAWMANTLHDEYKSSSFFVLSNQFIFLDYQASQLCVSCVKSTCCSQYRHLNTLYKLCTFAFQEYHFIINIALSHFYLLKDFFVVSSHFHFNFNTFELYFFLLSQTSLLKNSSKQQGFLFWLCMLVITCKKEIAVLPLSRHPHQTVGDIGHHTNHHRQAMLPLWMGKVFRAITDVSNLPNPLQIHSTGGRTHPTFDDGKHLKHKE